MGATVTTGKKASAFIRADGVIIYVLFESTYEKNCYPHTSHWSCIAIGDYAAVLKRIFLHASSCEGGMLQSRSGHIQPETYLTAWQREMAVPTAMPNVSITLQNGSSLYSTILSDRLTETRAALEQMGRLDAYDALLVGKVSLLLHDDIDLILAVYGVNGPLAPWRILDHRDSLTEPQPQLAPPFRAGRADRAMAPLAWVYRLDDDELVVRIGTGPWHHGGWRYHAVDRYINDVAYALELQRTGSGKQCIAAFRKLCIAAPAIPGKTQVRITRSPVGVQPRNVEQADKLATALGFAAKDRPAPEIFTCSVADIAAAKAFYPFKCLDRQQVAWEVPDMPSTLDVMATAVPS